MIVNDADQIFQVKHNQIDKTCYIFYEYRQS